MPSERPWRRATTGRRWPGHIHFEGELGANGLAGSTYFAGKHGMRILEAKVKPTDNDMSSQVSTFQAQGVRAIALWVSPTQLASVAVASEAQGLQVLLFGNGPNFASGLVNGPAAQALKARYFGGYPYAGFDVAPEVLTAVQQQDPSLTVPSTNAVQGYAAGDVMRQILERACANKDLTRKGVSAAKSQLTSVDTGGLTVPIDLSKAGVSPGLQSFMYKPADGPGGLTALEDAPYQGADVAAFPQQ